MLGEPHDLGRRRRASSSASETSSAFSACSTSVLDRPAVRAAVGMPEPLVDPLDHVVRERVAELVGVHVRLGRRVAHEVGQEALDQAVLADDALGPLDPGRRQDRLLVLAALDEPVGLEPLQHLARPTRARRRASRRRARRSRSTPSRAGTRRSGTRGSRSSRGTRRPNALARAPRASPYTGSAADEASASPARSRPGPPLASAGAARIRLSARLVPRRRPPVHLRGAGRRGQGRDRPGAGSGRSTTRGVVVEVGVEAPPGIKLSAAGKVLDEIPPALVDLALWIADYYGTTPARALELVAPLRRAPRGERPSPAERESLPGEAAPDELTPEQETAIARIVDGPRRSRAGAPPARRADRERQDRGLPPGLRGGARARPRHDRARAGDRARAADGRPVPAALRRHGRDPPLGARAGRAARRARSDRARRGADRRRRALGDLRADARPRPRDRRRGARLVVQAGVGSALRRAHRRCEAGGARGRGRGLRQRHAAARELGLARARHPLVAHRSADAARAHRRPPARARLPALGAAPDRARPGRREGRQGDPPAQPARRHAGAPLPRVRPLAPLRRLRRRPDAARRRRPALPPLRLSRGRCRPPARAVARSSSRTSARGRSGSRRSSSGTCPSSSGSGSTPTPRRVPARCARRSSASAAWTARC